MYKLRVKRGEAIESCKIIKTIKGRKVVEDKKKRNIEGQ